MTVIEKKMVKPFANSGDPDQTADCAASDLGLHCLQFTLSPGENGLMIERNLWTMCRCSHRTSIKQRFFFISLKKNLCWILPLET